jgi:VCBS repeat protein
MWQIVPGCRRPLVPALCFAVLLAFLQAGCGSSQPAARTGAAAPGSTPAASTAPAAGSQGSTASTTSGAGAASAQGKDSSQGVTPVAPAEVNKDVVAPEGAIPLAPPDGKWLTDEYGRKYFVTPIKKIPGAWAWVVEHKKVQLVHGLQFDVVSDDDKTFNVKIYGTDAKMATDIAEAAKRQVKPEELAAVAATYQTTIATSDRIVLKPFEEGLPKRAQWRNGFVIADVNGDGNLDIVHGPPRKGGNTPAIFLGDGKGKWRRWNEATFPPIPFDYGDVAVADFNKDGHPDLAISSHLRGITVVVGDGKGNFTPWSQGIEFQASDQDTPVFSSRAIAAVDWNGDGRPDILAWGEGPRLATTRIQGGGGEFNRGSRGAMVYLNQGDGTWKRQTAQDDRSYGDALVVADFNGDGHPDFAAASSLTGGRTVLYLSQPDGSWKGSPIEQLRQQATFRGIAAGDFNRDGRMDLAVGYASNELGVARTGIDVLLARPDGTWERRGLGFEPGSVGIWALGTGDLDGDGALDLVGMTGDGDGWVFLGDGKGSFTREQSPEVDLREEGCTGYHLELADLDRDGAAELIVGYAGEGSISPMGLGTMKCNSGGSLRVWKASRQGAH